MLPVWNWANPLTANSATHSAAVKTAKNRFIPAPFINVTDRCRSRMPADYAASVKLLKTKRLWRENSASKAASIQSLVENRSDLWIADPRYRPQKTAVSLSQQSTNARGSFLEGPNNKR